jgi:hypothetical protein
LVEQFMSVEPYSNAQRVFVIVDNGSAHGGKKSIKRLEGRYVNLILVHTPVHASWLNQAEIYFSVVQRKVRTPNDFPDLDTLEQSLLAFGRRYERSVGCLRERAWIAGFHRSRRRSRRDARARLPSDHRRDPGCGRRWW